MILIAVPWCAAGGLWNRGSIALACEWIAGQIWWYRTGNDVPINLYEALDLFVIVAFLWRAPSALGWCVIAIFPIEWYLYWQPDTTERWRLLWILTLAQMILAGPWPAFQRTFGVVSHGPRKPISFRRAG